MPAIIAFMLMNSGAKDLYEQRLENEESKGKAGNVLDHQIKPHRQAENRCNNRCGNDAGRVARYAVNRRADALFP
jgi:hypothetical protein